MEAQKNFLSRSFNSLKPESFMDLIIIMIQYSKSIPKRRITLNFTKGEIFI